jgi:hypothetical protein
MPAITKTSLSGVGQRAATRTTLGASGNTVTYLAGIAETLILHNPTAGALSPVIVGNGGTTVDITGLGTVNVAAGYAVGSIAAGGQVAVPLDTIAAYLKGTVDITGGTGLVATHLTTG